jgi:hypothetical protein
MSETFDLVLYIVHATAWGRQLRIKIYYYFLEASSIFYTKEEHVQDSGRVLVTFAA